MSIKKKEKDDLKFVLDKLQKKGLKITKPRVAVAQILAGSGYFSAEDISGSISSTSEIECDRVTVYRVLATFEELGIISKASFQGEANRYQLKLPSYPNSQNPCHKSHFFKCISCQKVEPIKSCSILKIEADLNQKGYKNLEHHLEINGHCPDCAS